MQVKDIMITKPIEVIPLLKGYSCKRQEYFGIICLNSGNKTISRDLLFIGGASQCNIDKKVIFWKIAKRQPSGVILFHNHPSDDATPSTDDVSTTQVIFNGLNLLGIHLVDHVIISKHDYFSFGEHDMLPSRESVK